ncbi:hypothetical protein BH10BAC4_BH10BAC4_00820 [soil metagenome]
MENKFRIGSPERTNESRVKPPPVGSTPGTGIFSGIERRLKLETYFEEGFPVQYLPKIMFVMVIGLLYIGNTHYAEKTVRRIDAAQSDVEDLRADYTTLKSDLMFASKQSEVARKVKAIGLKESLNPPTKVVIEEGEY